jgi:hypothetical protein
MNGKGTMNVYIGDDVSNHTKPTHQTSMCRTVGRRPFEWRRAVQHLNKLKAAIIAVIIWTKYLTVNHQQAPVDRRLTMVRPNNLAISSYHLLVPINANIPLYRVTATVAVPLLEIHGAIRAIQNRDKAHHHAISVRPGLVEIVLGGLLPLTTMNSRNLHRNGAVTRHKHPVDAVVAAATSRPDAVTIPIHCHHREPLPLANERLAL